MVNEFDEINEEVDCATDECIKNGIEHGLAANDIISGNTLDFKLQASAEVDAPKADASEPPRP